jgi:Phage integrase, N-terminal SAM-like domain
VQATGGSRKSAERAIKARLSQRASYASGYGAPSADSSFTKLVKVWLDDLDLRVRLAPSTRALYERNMRQFVMPVFEHYTLREITVRARAYIVRDHQEARHRAGRDGEAGDGRDPRGLWLAGGGSSWRIPK